MAVSKGKKAATLKVLEENLSKSKSVLFLNIQGLKVKEMEEMRRECAGTDSECMVAKKTLITLALKRAGIEELDPKGLGGEVAAVFAYGDEVAPAKAMAKYAKTHDALKLEGGLLMSAPVGARNLDAKGVARFALLPSRHELLGSLVGTISNPMRGLVTVMSGVPRGFVQVIKARSESI